MCEWLEVSRSGFYDWKSRPKSATAKRRELLKVKINALFEANNSEYGYRRIHALLARAGWTVTASVDAADMPPPPGSAGRAEMLSLVDAAIGLQLHEL